MCSLKFSKVGWFLQISRFFFFFFFALYNLYSFLSLRHISLGLFFDNVCIVRKFNRASSKISFGFLSLGLMM